MLNSVQTAGIIFVGIVLVYVVWRLERVMIVALATLRSMSKTQQELIRTQDAIEDSIADVWRRIERIESRQERLQQWLRSDTNSG
ncbi:MAG TPA: hypothetical protein VMI72_10055 [Roseiarcus sp.]|nr:hypothetical protein [Roseiarcus sp.]